MIKCIIDMMQIVECGVMATPALVVNDALVCQGKILTPDEIAAHVG